MHKFINLMADLPKPDDINISFEFFPPKTEKSEQSLWDCIMQLKSLAPKFVSVTYGAGGSSRAQTYNTVRRIQSETSMQPAAHLTCINTTKEEICAIADEYWQMGIRHIVALRGDIPKNETIRNNDFTYATDLIKLLMQRHDFDISVAAHPEGHPEARNLQQDIDNLKRKQDLGAKRAITQFFFDNDDFFRFMDLAQKQNITIDIIPGILPVTNFSRLKDLAGICGTKVPKYIHDLFTGLNDEHETKRMIANFVAAAQVVDLWKNGVSHFHFYTLNRPNLTLSLCHLLSVRSKN